MGFHRATPAAGLPQRPRRPAHRACASLSCCLFLLLAHACPIQTRAQQASLPGSHSLIARSTVDTADEAAEGNRWIAGLSLNAPRLAALPREIGMREEARTPMKAPRFAADSLPAASSGMVPLAASHLTLPGSVLHPDLRCQLAAQTFELSSAAAASAAECMRIAEILDHASLRPAALHAWQRVLAIHPHIERAHLRIAQLLLDAGNPPAAEDAARNALQVLPRSSSLYLIASQAMQHQGKEYEARKFLVQGFAATNSQELLARLATMQDAHGDGAAELYDKLAESPRLSTSQRVAALHRGFEVAMRDGDTALAGRLAERLEAAGHPEFQPLLRSQSASTNQTLIPGGLHGLASIAMSKTGVSSQHFLAEFARALLANVCTGVCFGGDEYRKSIEDYFATIAQLEALGRRTQNRVSISLGLGNADDNRRTTKVLGLLGIVVRNENGAIRVQPGVKQRQARKQDVVAALDIDLIGIEKALQAGKPYILEIQDEPVDIYPNPVVWEQVFPASWDAGFAQVLLHRPHIARLYATISEIDEHTLDALFQAVRPSVLAIRYAEELGRFGPAFAVSGDRAVVPGGPGAATVWKELVGASPDQPVPFFRALLTDPSLLAFFYAVSELDAAHQAFFTANPDRALRFYTLSKSLTAEREYHKDLAGDSTYTRFLRSVPLDHAGHVIFPGSPSVWLVAKGKIADPRHISMLEKRASETAAPALEDSILSHLAETGYDVQGLRSSELDNFLAVSRLNAHLKEPMDAQSAILLAQHYDECWPLYVDFSDLPGISSTDLRNFFSILDEVRQKPRIIQNLEMGQLYSLLGWVSILGRNQALPDNNVAKLFSQLGNAMQNAVGLGQTSVASLDVAKSIVASCGSTGHQNLDDGIRDCMLRKWSQDDDPHAVDFERVLSLQKAPRLADLTSITDAAQHILSAPEGTERSDREAAASALRADAGQISAAAARLPRVEIPGGRRIPARERTEIQMYDPQPIQDLARQLNESANSPNPNFKIARKVAAQLLTAIRPQVTAALAAPIYAYYLRSTDLIVSDDPLLLRKHRYVDAVIPLSGKQVIELPEFFASSEGAGSHFVGGFGEFALIAGHAAAAGFHQGGQGAEAMMAAQIAALRSARWDLLTEQDQRLAALRILAAREWIVRSATDPQYLEALTSATLGILSLSRRADLLNSIADHDWNTIWKSVPLPDLYTLGSQFSRYALSRTESSPVFVELHALESAPGPRNIDYLARIPNQVDGCSRLHMSVDAPYEEYARHLMQEDLAQRTADFKLYLASRADNAGVQPSDVGRVAEKLAARAFAASQLTDYHDWRSLFAAYSSITTHDLEKALQP